MAVKEEIRAKGARGPVVPFHWWLSTNVVAKLHSY